MPLFGKKKDNEKKSPPQGYPTQPAYPTQSYPTQPSYNPTYQQQGAVGGAPPPYTAAPPPGHAVQGQGQPPQYQPQGQGQPAQYQPQYYQPAHGQQPIYQPPASMGQTMVVQGGFDPGARFGPGTTANIPPPPPGCAPNAAQMGAIQGQNVIVTQREGNWFSGGSDGGYTVW
ncbi:DAZ-associated protein 2 [Lingula anatina]|uniref:DAZ-associated protein 2 n=1 Tax=Lingula anatina TaxID=7574 RepID=A0A1S3H0U5_LINAN|nr:DAZ-associated protein 2 [Lingula anatina]|eukprot:XP_013379623.1 DAZ-associated protein 2 [Lingula anatina]